MCSAKYIQNPSCLTSPLLPPSETRSYASVTPLASPKRNWGGSSGSPTNAYTSLSGANDIPKLQRHFAWYICTHWPRGERRSPRATGQVLRCRHRHCRTRGGIRDPVDRLRIKPGRRATLLTPRLNEAYNEINRPPLMHCMVAPGDSFGEARWSTWRLVGRVPPSVPSWLWAVASAACGQP